MGLMKWRIKMSLSKDCPIYNLKFGDDVDLIDKDPDNLQVMLNKLRGH